MALILLALGAVGHAILWVALVNRLHGLGIQRRWVNLLTWVCIILFAVAPIAVATVEDGTKPEDLDHCLVGPHPCQPSRKHSRSRHHICDTGPLPQGCQTGACVDLPQMKIFSEPKIHIFKTNCLALKGHEDLRQRRTKPLPQESIWDWSHGRNR